MADRKILCGKDGCTGVIAVISGERTVTLKRGDQSITTTGNHWSTIATCPKYEDHRTSVVVNEGKLDTTYLTLKEAEEDEHKEDDKKDE